MNNEDVREASRLQVPLSPARRAAMQALAVVKTGMNEMRIVQTIRMHKPFSGSQGGSKWGDREKFAFLRPSMTDGELRGNRQAWLAALIG
ncbi:hypothetical protein LD112_23770 [Pantoea agglomerans]|nr:hypothetical protein [Pantoea agglomerans]